MLGEGQSELLDVALRAFSKVAVGDWDYGKVFARYSGAKQRRPGVKSCVIVGCKRQRGASTSKKGKKKSKLSTVGRMKQHA